MSVDNEKLCWIRLARCRNIGPRIFKNLLEAYGSAQAILEELPRLIERQANNSKSWEICSAKKALEEHRKVTDAGGKMLTWKDDGYPQSFFRDDYPPPVLSCFGHPHVSAAPCVAIVGARNSSVNGNYLTAELSSDLSKAGYVVVSGMARGIDTAAHDASLSATPNSGTIAFLAGGINEIYPKENRELYERIKQTGAIFSEMPWSTKPAAHLFPRRNRLIAGVSQALVVVECALRSGSLLTAKLALDMGIDVMAVPGSPSDARGRGSNHLIKEGAMLIESADDVLKVLETQTMVVKEDTINISYMKNPPTLKEIDAAKANIKNAMSIEATSFEKLGEALDFPTSALRVALLEMEIDGEILRHDGDNYSINTAFIGMRQ